MKPNSTSEKLNALKILFFTVFCRLTRLRTISESNRKIHRVFFSVIFDYSILSRVDVPTCITIR